MAYIFPEDLLPGVPLTNFYDEGGGGGGGPTEVYILYYIQNLCTQKITIYF